VLGSENDRQRVVDDGVQIVAEVARRTAVWTVINGMSAMTGPIPEFRQAQARVKGGTTVPYTLLAYVPGSDPERSRDEVEHSFA
jgi:hypothetical protein